MLRRLWQVCKDISVWVVKYNSTKVKDDETLVFQYDDENGHYLGHITMHKNLKTGKVVVHQHGITEDWPNVDNSKDCVK